ncbi:hypothetical protein [Salinispora oceanensis]|uniref:hypothetical protein n=1 Tax=Salinispora oceanensis TaxID=1050199 RepID=UPI00037A4804|nr:hypothetical protein [Salinispora oceanensis]
MDCWADADDVTRVLAAGLEGFAEPLTVRGSLIRPDGSMRQVGPVWHNLPSDTCDQTVLELGALAARDVGTPNARESCDPADQILAVVLQHFIAAEVSVRGTVEPEQGEIRLLSCHGLDEDLGQGVWRDATVLDQHTGAVRRQHVTTKPIATIPADGGTRTAAVLPRVRNAPTLTPALLMWVTDLANALVEEISGAVSFELAVLGGTIHLLSCRPVTGTHRPPVGGVTTDSSGAGARASAPTAL